MEIIGDFLALDNNSLLRLSKIVRVSQEHNGTDYYITLDTNTDKGLMVGPYTKVIRDAKKSEIRSLITEYYKPKIQDSPLDPPKGFIDFTEKKEGGALPSPKLVRVSEIRSIGTNKNGTSIQTQSERFTAVEDYDTITLRLKQALKETSYESK